jgi:dihydroorotate dehydrogenase electron transfer subunit
MFKEFCTVSTVRKVGDCMFVLGFHAPHIAAAALPGQFVNIKPDSSYDPLLRRPFSVHRVEGDIVEVLFNVVGKGTSILADTHAGDLLDVLGPLGVGYRIDAGFDTAILVGGGLGVAPLPILTAALVKRGIAVHTFVGGRSKAWLSLDHLLNVTVATDDGSAGFHGTIVACLDAYLETNSLTKPKIFSCGPNRMLEALANMAHRRNIPCEAALECAMACGIGICQGCPVEMTVGDRKYNLVCTDGPVFDVSLINISGLVGH